MQTPDRKTVIRKAPDGQQLANKSLPGGTLHSPGLTVQVKYFNDFDRISANSDAAA
jgi:hypothetical protein